MLESSVQLVRAAETAGVGGGKDGYGGAVGREAVVGWASRAMVRLGSFARCGGDRSRQRSARCGGATGSSAMGGAWCNGEIGGDAMGGAWCGGEMGGGAMGGTWCGGERSRSAAG
jgi:hypothetical protein